MVQILYFHPLARKEVLAQEFHQILAKEMCQCLSGQCTPLVWSHHLSWEVWEQQDEQVWEQGDEQVWEQEVWEQEVLGDGDEQALEQELV